MAGVGTIDADFRPATRFDSWLDMRCRPYIEQLDRDHGDLITETTGCPPTCDHGPKILWWMHERPHDYCRVAKFVMPTCYVAGRAAGIRADEAYIDYTFLHFTALSEAREGRWSERLCGLLGVDRDRLPRVVAPWDVIGELRPGAAHDFGLKAGIPVAAGCGDTAAGALGAGLVRPGLVLDTAGTAAVLACSTGRFVADRAHRALLTMRSVVPGVWNPLAYIAGGGLALRWFREIFTPGERGYDAFFDLAKQAPPGCDGLLFSPHLGGRICPTAPEMRGAWTGFSWSHGRAHFARAILEAVAYEYGSYVQILGGLLPELELTEARVIGGGARSDFWNGIKAAVLGTPYRRVLRQESATWGAALIAGKAAGVIDGLAAHAEEHAALSADAIPPDPGAQPAYRRASEQYRAWQEHLRNGFRHHG